MKQTSSRLSLFSGDFFGAFGDIALLLPFLALLTTRVGFSSSHLFLSVGAIYFISGYVFRVPMAVQPLKALAASAIVGSATINEVRLAAITLAILFLCLRYSKYFMGQLKKVPDCLIHGMQFGLGILLLGQGLKVFKSYSLLSIVVLIASIALAAWGRKWSRWVFGATAMLGLAWAFVQGFNNAATDTILNPVLSMEHSSLPHYWILMSLVLPQLALTLANSVLATEQVCRRYFPDDCKKVTHERLLASIAWGNIATAAFSALPFCHGSGGVTAHYMAGARSYQANYIAGLFFIACGFLSIFGAFGQLQLGAWVVGPLLVATAISHVKLIRPSLENFRSVEAFTCLMMGAVAFQSQNLLWAALSGFGIYKLAKIFSRSPLQKARKAVTT